MKAMEMAEMAEMAYRKVTLYRGLREPQIK